MIPKTVVLNMKKVKFSSTPAFNLSSSVSFINLYEYKIAYIIKDIEGLCFFFAKT